jgi:hypothetical protein
MVAAAGTGEHQHIRVGAGRELPADRLDHPEGERDLADAGVALGAGLEAAAEPVGLVAHVHDLEHGRFLLEVDASAPEPGPAHRSAGRSQQGQHMVPPEQRASGEQLTGFLG